MVNTVGKPHALQIDLQGAELVGIVVYTEVGIDGLQRPSYQQVITAVLVERDVAPEQCRL